MVKILMRIPVKFVFAASLTESLPQFEEGELVLSMQGISLKKGENTVEIIFPQIESVNREGNGAIRIIHVHQGERRRTLLTGDQGVMKKFERNTLLLLLHKRIVYVKHPAVIGGAVQNDVEWTRGALLFLRDKKTGNQKMRIQREVDSITILLNNIESVDLEKQEFKEGKTKTVVNIKHSLGSETYNTFLISQRRIVSALITYLKNYLEETGAIKKSDSLLTAEVAAENVSDLEGQLLVALYSGMSPFELDGMLGITIDELEETYEKLVKKGLLRVVRMRRQVELTPAAKRLVNQQIKFKDTKEKPLY